jgi:hypothetical protein
MENAFSQLVRKTISINQGPSLVGLLRLGFVGKVIDVLSSH